MVRYAKGRIYLSPYSVSSREKFLSRTKRKKRKKKKKRKEKEGIVEKSGIKEWKLDELRSLSTRDYGHVQQKFHLANLEIAALMEILYPRLVDRL